MLGVIFNAFVVNKANKNGQIISTDAALSCVSNFKFKPMNIEHKRQNVIGLITGYAFSKYGSDEPMTEEEASQTSEPFNVVLTGFVWRVVSEDFASKLEDSSDPASENYLSISTSWEMGFKNFNIARGSSELSECEILETSEEIEEYKSSLLHFGGRGVDKKGSPLHINLIGEVLPL